jgi:glycosyltransferase involved in cell wall biosynthesis
VRVLAVNKFFYVRGGCERYYFDLEKLLRSHGHEVRHLSMTHPRNRPSPDSGHFVSEVDFSRKEPLGRAVKKGMRVIYSREARRAMDGIVQETSPDVVHLHNIAHQLSPSILRSLKRRGRPVVQTLHDYKLICPIYVLMRDGRICEDCRGGRFYNVVMTGCHPGGLGAALANAAEMYLHNVVLRSYDAVRLFICPSRFLMNKMIEFGVDGDRMIHLPYFIPVDEYRPSAERGSYYVFAGRLSREKGLLTLLEAASTVPDLKLVVLGEGPLGAELRERYGSRPWVEFRGHLTGDELRETISRAAFSVVPSQWYENLPLTVMESFALGVPVVASRIGGLPEMVIGGRTGLLCEPGDAGDLASAVSWLARNPDECRRMGERAREFAEREYGPEAHYARMMEAYGKAMQ